MQAALLIMNVFNDLKVHVQLARGTDRIDSMQKRFKEPGEKLHAMCNG